MLLSALDGLRLSTFRRFESIILILGRRRWGAPEYFPPLPNCIEAICFVHREIPTTFKDQSRCFGQLNGQMLDLFEHSALGLAERNATDAF